MRVRVRRAQDRVESLRLQSGDVRARACRRRRPLKFRRGRASRSGDPGPRGRGGRARRRGLAPALGAGAGRQRRDDRAAGRRRRSPVGRSRRPPTPGSLRHLPGALVFAPRGRNSGARARDRPGEADLARSGLGAVGAGAGGDAGWMSRLLAGGQTILLPACGAGCYQSQVETSRLAGRVVVMLDAPGYPFTLPSTLSLPDGTGMVVHAGQVWRGAEDARLARAARGEPDRRALHGVSSRRS